MLRTAQDSEFITHYSINVIIVTVIITIDITVSSYQWLFWSKDEAKGTVIPEKILKANPGSSSEMKNVSDILHQRWDVSDILANAWYR